MKLAILLLPVLAWAQTQAQVVTPAPVLVDTVAITCQVDIEPASFMKVLYSNKVPVLTGNLWCKNIGTDPFTMGVADIYISLPINLIPGADAGAALTKVYGQSKLQTALKIADAGTMAVGGLAALTGKAAISVTALGYLVFGAGAFKQGVDIFANGTPSLSTLLGGQCDGLFSNVKGFALLPNGEIFCKVYVARPDKGVVGPPSSIGFQLMVTGPVVTTPLPPAPPIKAVHPRVIEPPLPRPSRTITQLEIPDTMPLRTNELVPVVFEDPRIEELHKSLEAAEALLAAYQSHTEAIGGQLLSVQEQIVNKTVSINSIPRIHKEKEMADFRRKELR